MSSEKERGALNRLTDAAKAIAHYAQRPAGRGDALACLADVEQAARQLRSLWASEGDHDE